MKFARGAENQAMLAEAVTGIQTFKATALEPAFARRWDNRFAAYVSASFKTQNLATWAHEGVNLIGKWIASWLRRIEVSLGKSIGDLLRAPCARPSARLFEHRIEIRDLKTQALLRTCERVEQSGAVVQGHPHGGVKAGSRVS